LLAEYEKSGMSGAAFAEHLGIKYQTFASWAQKKRKRARVEQKAPEVKHPVQWVEALVARTEGESIKPGVLIVRLAGGAVIQIADRSGALLAAELLNHLGERR
jgi:predicted alpha/beta hydrolase family esterase